MACDSIGIKPIRGPKVEAGSLFGKYTDQRVLESKALDEVADPVFQ
jgi:hypothetical protein